MKRIYVGIDISKETLDLCIKRENTFSFKNIKNRVKAIEKLLKTLKKEGKEVFIAMENTGHYNFNLYDVLEHFNFKVFVIDPKHLKRSIGLTRGKNDKVDAKRIAVFIERNYQDFQTWTPTSESMKTMKVLFTERDYIKRQRASLKQKTTALKHISFNKSTEKLIKMHKKSIDRMTQEIKEIEAMIRKEVNADEHLKKEIQRLKTIPGVGDVMAWTFAIKTEGFTRLTNPRKLGCYAGVVPFEQQSGTSLKTKPRVSKMADTQMKTTLQMAAMRAVRMKNDLQHYYERKVKEGKNKMSVLNAVRNKIIHIAMALIRNQTFYQNRLELS